MATRINLGMFLLYASRLRRLGACEASGGKPVEQQWKTCGSRQKLADVIFIWLPRRRTRSVLACGYGPVLHDPQSGF